mmetsp:Transcript_45350/g.97893  ORF Transcript_45350/g.97893 Transcript_45350/m.97893 type:complete len:157 (-) Transcript_45350:194-664(-)
MPPPTCPLPAALLPWSRPEAEAAEEAGAAVEVVPELLRVPEFPATPEVPTPLPVPPTLPPCLGLLRRLSIAPASLLRSVDWLEDRSRLVSDERRFSMFWKMLERGPRRLSSTGDGLCADVLGLIFLDLVVAALLLGAGDMAEPTLFRDSRAEASAL